MSDVLDLANHITFLTTPTGQQFMSSQILMDNISERLAFGDPGDIMFIMRYFKLKRDALIDSDIAEKLKTIYRHYKNSEFSLYEFITDISIKLGGKFSTDIHTFFDKFYTYLYLIDLENNITKDEIEDANKTLELIRAEKKQLESGIESTDEFSVDKNENSNTLQ